MKPRINISMKPKKSLIDALKADTETVANLNHALSAAALLRLLARSFEDEADDAMKKYGLHCGDIKKYGRASDKAFDDYNHVITQLYVSDTAGAELLDDYEKLREIVENEPITEKIRGFIQ